MHGPLLAKAAIADTLKDMKALAVLYAGRPAAQSYEPVFGGRCALSVALERTRSFPDVAEILILASAATALPADLGPHRLLREPSWDTGLLLKTLAEESRAYDYIYYAWADCPFLDPVLARAIADRHLRYAAEYSYADGWPYGLAPELLTSTTAGLLSALWGDGAAAVERDTLFQVIQKDINAFDIETEISPVDLRGHRLTLAADSKRNLLLLTRLADAGLRSASDAERVIAERPELLRTLPAYYQIQVSGPCPQTCSLCPYPRFGAAGGAGILERRDFMPTERFEALLDRIVDFSGDAVVSFSAWGELSLHPAAPQLIRAVLARPALAALVETSGLGWKNDVLDELAADAAAAAPRLNCMAPLSWVVSLDSDDPQRYGQIRGPGYGEAVACAKALMVRFPSDAYVQALRVAGAEDDLERFYRNWKAAGAKIIVQKHDDFCGYLPTLKAGDISPIKRHPCRHLMRDLTILLDGSVPFCREDVEGTRPIGNAFEKSLEELWSASAGLYGEHCAGSYQGICAGCDEYYTYNF